MLLLLSDGALGHVPLVCSVPLLQRESVSLLASS